MNAIWFIVTTFIFVNQVVSKTCLEAKKELEKKCLSTEYENYIECVRTRMKRSYADCDGGQGDTCNKCNCNSCQYSQCEGSCDNCCNSCCSNYVQCHTNHCCHKQCHSECRTSSCRGSCRKSCYDSIYKESEKESIYKIESKDSQQTRGNTSNVNTHNITTIINLENIINNTNLIDVPINLDYTNRNNISLIEGRSSSSSSTDGCCIVIGPRQCVPTPTPPYTRCFHTRTRQCDSYCTSNIVHQEQTQICSRNSFGQPINCQKQINYIPQPQPRCTYTSTWPYVWCGIQKSASCEGCYGHYYKSEAKEYQNCPPQCYDDFSVGPLYRQGPMYQPSYSHASPCNYSPSGCNDYGYGAYGGYGGFSGVGAGYAGGFGYNSPYQMPPPMPYLPPLMSPLQSQGWNFPYNNLTADNQTYQFPNKTGLLDITFVYPPYPLPPSYAYPDKEVEIEVETNDQKANVPPS